MQVSMTEYVLLQSEKYSWILSPGYPQNLIDCFVSSSTTLETEQIFGNSAVTSLEIPPQ